MIYVIFISILCNVCLFFTLKRINKRNVNQGRIEGMIVAFTALKEFVREGHTVRIDNLEIIINVLENEASN